MTDEQGEPLYDGEHPLDAAAREAGDPRLFPDEVRALFDLGQARKARKLLLRLAGEERDQDRSALQYEAAEHPRLWLDPLSDAPGMHTFNGIGTMLYGRHLPEPDGSYIATLWFTILFVPLWPLGSYLVARAEEGGWYFLAKAPFSRLALGVRRFAWMAILVAVGQIAWNTYWSSTHTDLIAYNGFDRPITVTVAGEMLTVQPWRHAVFEDLRREPASIEAKWPDEQAPFESLDFDFTDHGYRYLIYNVANRGALRVDFITYGGEIASEGWWLDGGPVNRVRERIDYVFVDPPESKYLEEDKVVQNSILYDAGAEGPAASTVVLLLEEGLDEWAMEVARAQLAVDPTDAWLATVTALRLLADDLPAQFELFHQLIARSPTTVDLHRYYQNLWPDARQEDVMSEYAELLAKHPSDPMYHYLVGRLQEDGSPVATAHYTRALELDPNYGPVFRALGYEAAQDGDWALALEHYGRYAALDPEGGVDALDERVRIRRRLGKPADETASLITTMAASGHDSYFIQRTLAHLRVADDPAAHAEAAHALVRYAEVTSGEKASPAVVLNLQADMAITAGALDQARTALSEVPDGYRSPDIALRLALSSDAKPGDWQLLMNIPGWFYALDPPGKLMAFRLLAPEAQALALGQWDAYYKPVAGLLQSPHRLKDRNRMIEATRRIGSSLRVAAYLAAADALEGVPGSGRARMFYMREAYAMALPGELPFRINGQP